jgi:hypothetical protein
MSGSSQKKKHRKNRIRRGDVSHKVKTSLVPTIAVIGLRYGQAAMVEEMCGGVARPKFVDADQSQPVLPQADAVFLLTRFISHRWTEAAHHSFSRNRIHLIPGGISALVHRIRLKAAKIFLLNADSAQ